MNSYFGMTVVKKEQGQDDYSSQQGILLTITSLNSGNFRVRKFRAKIFVLKYFRGQPWPKKIF